MSRIQPSFRAFGAPLRNTQTTYSSSSLRIQLQQARFYQKRAPNLRIKRFEAHSGGRSSGGYTDGFSGLFFRWVASPTFYRDCGLISAGAGGFYWYNLEEVPVSGRRRFNIISPQMEESMGRASVDQIKEEYKGRILPHHDKRVQQVKRVLERLLPYAKGNGLENLDWEVNVIDSPEQNAFVAPGGKVFVFTGILPLCKDEDGIAAVLGHEIAHVVAHHTAFVFAHYARAPRAFLTNLCI